MINKLTDRLFLILAALICSGLIVLTIAFVRPRFSEEWAKFIYASLIYLVILIYVAYPKYYNRLTTGRVLLFQITYYVLTTGIAFVVFRYGPLPLPKGSLTYVIPGTVLSVVSLVVLDYLRKRLKFFKNKNEVRRK